MIIIKNNKISMALSESFSMCILYIIYNIRRANPILEDRTQHEGSEPHNQDSNHQSSIECTRMITIFYLFID
jgi:hypothetical protein